MTSIFIKNIVLLSFAFAPSFALAQQNDSTRMDSIIHSLPEVFVKGEKPICKIHGSTIIYDMSQLIKVKNIDNIYSALGEIPGVDYQDGNFMLAGMNATVVIDGKVSSLSSDDYAALLKSIPASRIASVEVSYNALPTMHVRGTVINIKTKKHNSEHSSIEGEINVLYSQSHDAAFREGSSLLYRNKKFTVDFIYSNKNGENYTVTNEHSKHFLNGEYKDVQSEEIMKSKSFSHLFRFDSKYTFTTDHELEIAYQCGYSKSRNRYNISGNILGNMNSSKYSWLHDFRIDYTIPFGLTAGAEMTYYNIPERQLLNSSLSSDSIHYRVYNKQRLNIWKFYMDQEMEVNDNVEIFSGLNYRTSINHSGQDYLEGTLVLNKYPESTYTRQREDEFNAYIGASMKLNEKINLDASISANYFHNPMWKEWHLYPLLNITYHPASSHTILFALETNRNYPDYWDMTDFISYSHGGYNEIVGNPNLKPSDDYHTQLVYLFKNKYQFTTWYNYTSNYFIQMPYQLHNRLTIRYQNQNIDFQQQCGIQIYIPLTWTEWLDSYFTIMGVYVNEKASQFYDITFNRDITWGMIRMSNDIKLSSHMSLSITGKIRTKSIQAIYNLPASGNLDICANIKLAKNKLSGKIFCNDILQTSSINPRITYGNQNLKMKFACYRTFGLSLVYKFGGYKEEERKKVDTTRFKK